MKTAEFTKLALSGKPLIVAEYRATEAEEINRKVVKVGESATMPIVKHKVLVGNDSWEVAEFLPAGANIKDVKSPFTMRDLIVIEVETMEKTKWGNRLSGTIHGKLEA